MIALIARGRATPGHEAELENTLLELGQQVQNNEPGCLLYQVCKNEATGELVILERYKDEAALAEHQRTPYFAAAFEKIDKLVQAPPVLEMLVEL